MIRGMTGFGSAQFSSGKIKGSVEIKSLNHRYLDVTFYSPSGFNALENKVRQMMDQVVSRGKVTVSIKIIQKPPTQIVFNREVIQQYLKYARQLRREFDLKNDLSLSDLTQLPGVIDVRETMVSVEAIWPTLEKAVTQCLKSLTQMRVREGKSLALDVKKQLQRMKKQVKTIQVRAKGVLAMKKKELSEEEFVSFQKSSDVNEEIARLMHFIDEIGLLFSSDIPAGKQMDFIAQEMQRETNTIGSKLQEKIISSAVIALKSKIEKIREQAQNIE